MINFILVLVSIISISIRDEEETSKEELLYLYYIGDWGVREKKEANSWQDGIHIQWLKGRLVDIRVKKWNQEKVEGERKILFSLFLPPSFIFYLMFPVGTALPSSGFAKLAFLPVALHSAPHIVPCRYAASPFLSVVVSSPSIFVVVSFPHYCCYSFSPPLFLYILPCFF